MFQIETVSTWFESSFWILLTENVEYIFQFFPEMLQNGGWNPLYPSPNFNDNNFRNIRNRTDLYINDVADQFSRLAIENQSNILHRRTQPAFTAYQTPLGQSIFSPVRPLDRNKIPPQGYLCHSCWGIGHYIKHCPKVSAILFIQLKIQACCTVHLAPFF